MKRASTTIPGSSTRPTPQPTAEGPTVEAAVMVALRDETRLAQLVATALLDTPVEEAFDRLTRLATRLLGAPTALLSLVTPERQFLRAPSG